MFFLILGMFLSVVLALAVLGMVAIPARREGRDLLTPKGEEVVSRVREKSGEAMDTAREKTGEAMDAAREKTSEAIGTARDKVAEVTASKDD
jgi:ElaB/YqjD/DUF883 family membrane-anchored ribosome-binding protein